MMDIKLALAIQTMLRNARDDAKDVVHDVQMHGRQRPEYAQRALSSFQWGFCCTACECVLISTCKFVIHLQVRDPRG